MKINKTYFKLDELTSTILYFDINGNPIKPDKYTIEEEQAFNEYFFSLPCNQSKFKDL